MRRRLLTLATVLSFLLCAGFLWLWPRSHRLAETVTSRRADPERHARLSYSVRNSRGRVVVQRYRNVIHERWVHDFFEARSPWRGWTVSQVDPSQPLVMRGGEGTREWAALGFGYFVRKIDPPDYSEHSHALMVPHWFLVAVTAWLPGAWAVRAAKRARARRKERRRGHCHACGYDLRASKGRCPECGAAFAAESTL